MGRANGSISDKPWCQDQYYLILKKIIEVDTRLLQRQIHHDQEMNGVCGGVEPADEGSNRFPVAGGRRGEEMKFNIPGVRALCLQRTKENRPAGVE